MLGYDDALSPGEPRARQEPLERAAAVQVGLLQFAWSRLDMHLGLSLGWARGEGAPAASREAGLGLDFHAKLDALAALLAKQPESEWREGLTRWIAQCRALEVLAPGFMQGRWLPDVRSGRIVHLYLAPGGQVAERSHTLLELKALVGALDQHRADLQTLRYAAGQEARRAAARRATA